MCLIFTYQVYCMSHAWGGETEQQQRKTAIFAETSVLKTRFRVFAVSFFQIDLNYVTTKSSGIQ